MSTETPQGLWQFPITKFCMICTVSVPIVASLSDSKYWFVLNYDPFITTYRQYFRYILFQLAAVNESDVAIITLLWYNFRQLERLMGCRKYLSIIALSWFYTTTILAISNKLINLNPLFTWNRFSTGALPILLALFHFYKEYTPQIYEFEVLLTQPFGSHSKQLRWKLNDQFVINALIILLCLNQGLTGISSGFLSWLCGVFIDKGLFPGSEKFRLPFLNDRMNRSATTIANSNVTTNNSEGEPPQGELNEEEIEEPGDEPARPLGVQFLDTFRR